MGKKGNVIFITEEDFKEWKEKNGLEKLADIFGLEREQDEDDEQLRVRITKTLVPIEEPSDFDLQNFIYEQFVKPH